ncbi:glycoside hydrolase family 3 C-terminal domain-containing protein [Streptomyces sp. NPDC056244]|uniref:glycoside hydrolase family 3 C-terminal domain-containing protein n=1 Tax=Streptomyces sp. NPDC056244 TaxID=3345762 RepID=UPI0035D74722
MHERPKTAGAEAALSLEEKAALLCGQGTWETTAIPRSGIRSITLTDGPHGVRRLAPGTETFSFDASEPATCFPTGAALGSSWDVDLLDSVGAALGRESRAAGVSVLLGPGINIKRSPLCGRNFEYLSEDPVVSGHLAAALVRGVQSTGVGASLKHFAANNQETDRMRVSAQVDERTLREIYLAGFEYVITQAAPWTVMAAYNRINGIPAAHNRWLLSDVLRQEWGFEGLVVSDWGAVSDPEAAVAAGLDLEMPTTHGASAARLVAAVQAGRLEESVLDRAVARLLALLDRTACTEASAPVDLEAHHALARRAAAESAVLLRNEDNLLPLDSRAKASVAVIGEFARSPRFQGAGSSRVRPTRVDTALDALKEAAGQDMTLSFAAGFSLTGQPDQELLAEAVAAAAAAETAIVFLGLPEGQESEGFDRTHLRLPDVQLQLLEEIAQVNSNIVAVLANGGVVETATWQHRAKAVLEGWLHGQAGGGAVADLLFGRVNPSGRLAETIPLRLQDTPSHLNFPGSEGTVLYGERLYVGYRYYDSVDMPVSFPFGHGLSYTTFRYSDLRAEVLAPSRDGAAVRLRLTLANTGPVTGKEVVQVYVGDAQASVDRPLRELKAFQKIELAPGQSTTVMFDLSVRDLSFYSPQHGDWVLESGDFHISVGSSSRDLRLAATVQVSAPAVVRPLSMESSVGEWLAHPEAGPILRDVLNNGEGSAMAADPEIFRMIESLPMERLVAMSAGRINTEALNRLAEHTAVSPS